MKWVKNAEDSRIIERELDDIKSNGGQSSWGGNYGGAPAGVGNFAADSDIITVRPAVIIAVKRKPFPEDEAEKASSPAPAGS